MKVVKAVKGKERGILFLVCVVGLFKTLEQLRIKSDYGMPHKISGKAHRH